MNEYLGALADAGVVECVEENKGSRPGVWRLVGEIPEHGAAWLPTVDLLERGGQ